GDKAKMQRLIANFLDNAMKYTPAQGSVQVTLEDTGTTIVIRFTDTGIGIPSSEIPRIFDRFYRGDASRSSAGTGLGLSLQRPSPRHSGAPYMLRVL
ncbi:MAG TPA: sensor histidine kinase, partial [Deltaproteobacteria bacterium]|nr:sensor histidine kinase [Deltaproteobacteria bacterium]